MFIVQADVFIIYIKLVKDTNKEYKEKSMNRAVIIVGIFFVGFGVGYAVFNATQPQIQSLETSEPIISNAQNMLIQGSNMMEQGANMMMEGMAIIDQDRERGEEMIRIGSMMMEQGYSMMKQGSNMMDYSMMNMRSMNMQNLNEMIKMRDQMMNTANIMMQNRDEIINNMNRGMMQGMNQNMMNMGQYVGMMGSMSMNMQQMQGMMGDNMMMGSNMQGMMNMNNNMVGMMNMKIIEPLTIDNVGKELEEFVRLLDPNFGVKDVMEFENNFYAIVYEKDTGIGAFEILVWKIGQMQGMIHPEPGPNMMWNAKYGMFTRDVEMKIDEQEAKDIAQRWLDKNMPGSRAEEVEEFYGYYTLHEERDGKIVGMLSVNGITGDVWYHHWHGEFIQTL